MALEIPLGTIGPRAAQTLPLAVRVSYLAADRFAMPFQRGFVRVQFAAVPTSVRPVRVRHPAGIILKQKPRVTGAIYSRVKGRRVVRQMIDRRWRTLWIHLVIRFALCTLKWHAGRISSILDDVDQEYALCNWNIKEIPFQRKKKEKKYSIKFKKGNENTNYLGCDWSSWVRASILVVNR